MRNILLECAYVGDNYHGFQIQPNCKTVAGEINRAVGRVLCEDIEVIGCSRTDSGVHAKQFFLNFKTEKTVPTENILRGTNTYLPPDIVIKAAREVPLDFHARYDTLYKEYKYYILNSKIPSPFYEKRAYFYNRPLSAEAMKKSCGYFVGTHDFRAFCSTGNDYDSTVRTVRTCEISKDGDMVVLTVAADGFLYNMVRIIVGTLIDVGIGKISPGSIPEIIEKGERNESGDTVPPHGLYLNRVVYKEEDMNG